MSLRNALLYSKHILKRKSRLILLLSLIFVVVYELLDHTGKLLVASPVTFKGAESPEKACEDFFSSLISQKQPWKTNFLTKDRQEIINSVQRMRIYGQCYLRNNFTPKSFKLSDVEKQLFHVFSNDVSEGFHDSKESTSMWSSYGKGRGIVLSLGTNHFGDFRKLIATLSALGNTLPIEVIYKGDLRPEDIQGAIMAGRNTPVPQKIRFINVENRITGEHFAKFSKFANKWLAILFNSFEEMIFLDADVVPFINPEKMFDMDGYKSTGSYLFRDRAVADELLSVSAKALYMKLLPTEVEAATFDLPNSARKRFGLMTDRRHLVESGVVLMNRRKFMPGFLIGFALQLWEATSSPIWGDKELFWMGQSIAGEEDYTVSPRYAGTVGVIKDTNGNPIDIREKPVGVDNEVDRGTTMVCSAHPAHFSEKNELLWINSGLKECKLGAWITDYDKFENIKKNFNSREELRQFYESAVQINGAIIPPMRDLALIDDWNPSDVGFQKRENYGCFGYIWCAFDNPKGGYPATKIIFDAEQLKHIDEIKQVWMGA